MDREKIIQMARDAEEIAKHVTPQGSEYKDEFVLRFASAIRAATKEEDARIVEPSEDHRMNAERDYIGGKEGVELLDNAAEKIRASK